MDSNGSSNAHPHEVLCSYCPDPGVLLHEPLLLIHSIMDELGAEMRENRDLWFDLHCHLGRVLRGHVEPHPRVERPRDVHDQNPGSPMLSDHFLSQLGIADIGDYPILRLEAESDSVLIAVRRL